VGVIGGGRQISLHFENKLIFEKKKTTKTLVFGKKHMEKKNVKIWFDLFASLQEGIIYLVSSWYTLNSGVWVVSLVFVFSLRAVGSSTCLFSPVESLSEIMKRGDIAFAWLLSFTQTGANVWDLGVVLVFLLFLFRVVCFLNAQSAKKPPKKKKKQRVA